MPSPPAETDDAPSSGLQPGLIAALVYFAASVALTWPLTLESNSVLFGDYGDSRGVVWSLWAKKNGFLDGAVNPLLAAPFGIPAVDVIRQPVTEWLAMLVAQVSNEVSGYNFVVLLSFPLTALATYWLLDKLLHNRLAAFIGGLAFGFCPAAVMQSAGGHIAFAFNLFIPLFVLALFYNRSRRTIVSALCVAATFAGICLTAVYFGYFAVYIALYFVAYDYLSRERPEAKRFVRNYLQCATFAVLMVLPVEFMAVVERFASSREALVRRGHARDFGELTTFSSRFFEYFVPSMDHPVFGRHVEQFVRNHLHGSNVFEQTLYLGAVPVALLLTGVVLAARRKFDPDLSGLFLFFAFGALWTYFLSLPPILIGDVPTLSYFAYELAPMFRAYVRFGVLVNLFVACAAAVVLTQLCRRRRPARHYAMLAVLLPLLAFEYWSIPPGYALPVDGVPEVYRWLAKEGGDVIIAEYPMIRSDEAAFYSYPFWQRVHGKRLVNGASPDNDPAWEFFLKVNDLAAPETPGLLRSAGVKYVIVHTRMYEEGPIPAAIKRYYPPARAALTINGGSVPPIPQTLKLQKSFGHDMVFVFVDHKAGERTDSLCCHNFVNKHSTE